jgi:nitrite reductase/ring-hydroxylating ferredoxin subunit
MVPPGYQKVADFAELRESRALEVEVGPLPLFLHLRGDKVYATGVYCAHQDVRLHPGNYSGDLIFCTAHGYRMDIRTGACLNEPDMALPIYPVLVEGGEVFVKLS